MDIVAFDFSSVTLSVTYNLQIAYFPGNATRITRLVKNEIFFY